MEVYDVVIIGGGPNGETLAAYLQKAGAKCLLIERRDEMGGGLATQDYGAFRFNLHATYMMMAELMPPVHDLFLAQYGVDFIRPEVQMSLFYEKNKALVFYLDPNKTAESVGKVAPEDKAKFLKFYGDIKEVCEKCLLPATYASSIPPAEYAVMLSQSDIGNKVLQWSEMSPLEMLEQYEIKDERLKAGLIYLGCKWGIEPDLIGIGYMFAIYTYRMLNSALVRGGSHRLNSGIMRAGYESGLEAMENTEVTKIIVEDGEAKGVVVDAKEEVRAKVVVSTLNPQKTFFDFVGEEKVDPSLASAVKEWQLDEWSLFCIHLGTRGIPRYKAEETEPHSHEALSQVFGYSSSDEVAKHWKDCMSGTLPGTASVCSPISLFDPTQAPRDCHTLRIETEAPFEVSGKSWEDIKNDYANGILADWKEYLTNWDELRIVKRFVYPPSYIEQKLPSMVRGGIKHGAYTPTQMGYFRPNTDCSNYATPIRNLYLAGASTYPGGMITLGSGYNAAKRIATDLKLNIWWQDPASVVEARKSGLVP
jgi:phytoene dehydrogenase-like protein